MTLKNLYEASDKLLKSPHVSFIFCLVYLSIVNLLYLKTTPEILFAQFAILTFFFQNKRFKNFFKEWFIFIGLFVIYEFIRGTVDDVSPFYNTTLYWVYDWEMSVFGTLPTQVLQNIFPDTQTLLDIGFFFHSIFFYYSFVIAFILWTKKEKSFTQYKWRFLSFSFFSALIFFLIPTAPPWFVALERDLEIKRLLFESTLLTQFEHLSIVNYMVNSNLVAALPSLHAGWPAFTSIFLIKHFNNRIAHISLIVPIMISFTIVYTGEHYVLDVLLGWVLAIVFVYGKIRRI